jgi:hypothetical protein
MEQSQIATYAGTILIFPDPDSFAIDLRKPLRPDEGAALSRRGLSGPFGVVTAYNPLGQQATDESNVTRHLRLLDAVAELGFKGIAVDGASPDLEHREPSLALQVPRGVVIRLAAEFRQDAIFWFDGDRFWLVTVGASLEPIPLPLSG